MSAIHPEAVPPASPLVAGPQALRLAISTPRRYGLDRQLQLLSLSALPIAQATLPAEACQGLRPASTSPTETASVWPFPGPLQAQARAGSATPYDVVLADNCSDHRVPLETVENVTWVTLLGFRLRRLEGIAHQYELLGTDAVDCELLRDLWRHLAATATAGTAARLLFARAADARGATCLTELAADPSMTFIVRTRATAAMAPNAHPGRPFDAGRPGSCHASFEDLAPWLRLLCEASAVAGQGYCFGFTGSDGSDLPAAALDDDGCVTLTLLVIAGEQRASPLAAGRRLLPFNNAALVGPGLDVTTKSLHVEAADDTDTEQIALVPPGNVGLSLTLATSDVQTPQAQLQALFSKATCQLVAPALEVAAAPMQPGSVESDGFGLDGRGRARNDRLRRAGRAGRAGREVVAAPAPGCWRHDQIVPVARFGPPSRAAAVPGLPDPDQDPYRGVGSRAVIQFDVADPPADATAAPHPVGGTLTVPVGYTDPLAGVADWPGVSTSFTLQPAEAGAQILIGIAAQPAVLQPRPGQAHDHFTDGARRLADRFAAIHFQLAQPALSLSVVTSLLQDGNGDLEPVALDGLAPLRAFAAAAFVAARAAATLLPVQPFAAAPGTLGSVRDRYGPSWAEIAQANAATPIAALLGAQAVTVPPYIAFAAGDTAAGLVARAPDRWPALTAEALFTRNAELPLRAGAVLASPATVVDVTAPESLDALAARHHTTAALLACDSCRATGVLRSGFVFEMGSVAVTVGATPAGWTQPIGTLDDVHRAFAALGASDSIGAIAARNGSKVGMFVPGAQLATQHYVTCAASAGPSADSLAHNASGVSVADLAALNGNTGDLFEPGTRLDWGCLPSPVPAAGELGSLHDFAERNGITAELLLQANAALQLPAGSPLQVPATVSLPGDAVQLRVPYTVRQGDSLAGVAAVFLPAARSRDAAFQLAAANLTMPGTVAAGTITVAGVQVTTRAGDSLGSVLAQLQARSGAITLSDLVAAIGGTSGHLAVGGLLICPPALLPGSVPLTPAQVADIYGVDAVAFAQANAGVLGLVAADVALRLSQHDASKRSITTRDRDTFNRLVSRFAAQGVVISLAELVADLHSSAFLKAGAMALLPPAAVVLDTATAVGAGPFATAAFRLTVALRLQRPADAVDAAFRTACGDGPVERAESVIPAASEVLSGEALHARLRGCLPSLRFAAGQSAHARTEPWAVSFGTGDISQVRVVPGVTAPEGKAVWPRMFALRPLYAAPVSLSVEARSLQDDGGLSAGATAISFQGVDVETWARRFLADVDLMLSAACVDAAFRNEAARATLDAVLAAKAGLSSSIAAGLAAMLELKDPGAEAGLAEARSALEQALRLQLSPTYAVSAVLQYDTTAQSPWTSAGPHAAWLQGSAGPAVKLTASVPAGAQPASAAYTLATGRIRLDSTPSFMTVLMTANAVATDSLVHVDAQYECSDLDLDAHEEPFLEGCKSLRRLGFSPPLKDDCWPAAAHIVLGAADVPLPRRDFPARPALLAQRATRNADLPKTPEDAIQWSYELSYAFEHAAQDELNVEVSFDAASERAQARSPDATELALASALARYMAVTDPLRARLGGLAHSATRLDAATLALSAQTFAALVTDVADAWGMHWERARPSTGHAVSSADPARQAQRLSYRVRLTAAQDPDAAALVLTRLDRVDRMDRREAPTAPDVWPDIRVAQPDGEALLLTPGAPVGDTRIYRFPVACSQPPAVAARFSLTWTGLSLILHEQARASLSVQRNRQLLGAQGPDTQDAFLFRTPCVEAGDAVAPLITSDAPMDISTLGDTVAKALAAVFTAVTPHEPEDHPRRVMSLTAHYEHALGSASAADPGLRASVPVLLLSEQPIAAATATATAEAVAQALAAWQQGNHPVRSHAQWALTLRLFSSISIPTRKPLLVLDMLYPIPA